MRASFLVVVTLAVIVGLGVAAAVKLSGLLTPPAPVVVPPKVESKVEPPLPVPVVLVPSRTLYAGDAILPGDVRARALRPEEVKDYQENKAKYLPPSEALPVFRLPTKNLEADQPLLRDDLAAIAKPDPMVQRLAPGLRAVNVTVLRTHSAGGLIAVSDWVDVYLTTDVGRSDRKDSLTHTGLVARAAQVIAKRDTLWSIYAPLPPEPALQYTLAVNPYRAALLEYSRGVGTFGFAAASAAEKKLLDERKAEALADAAKANVSPWDTSSPEYKAEQELIDKQNRGQLGIGVAHLATVLKLPPIEPLPPVVVVEPPPPTRIEVFTGTQSRGTTVFQPVTATKPTPPPPPEPAQFRFSVPQPAEKK